MQPGGRSADDLHVTEWEQELARIDLDRLPDAARRLVVSLVEQWRREDVELAEPEDAGEAAAA